MVWHLQFVMALLSSSCSLNYSHRAKDISVFCWHRWTVFCRKKLSVSSIVQQLSSCVSVWFRSPSTACEVEDLTFFAMWCWRRFLVRELRYQTGTTYYRLANESSRHLALVGSSKVQATKSIVSSICCDIPVSNMPTRLSRLQGCRCWQGYGQGSWQGWVIILLARSSVAQHTPPEPPKCHLHDKRVKVNVVSHSTGVQRVPALHVLPFTTPASYCDNHSTRMTESVSSRPNSPAPTATTVRGKRAEAFEKLLNGALEHTLSKVSYDNFAACFPTWSQYKSRSLKDFHRQFLERLKATCQVSWTIISWKNLIFIDYSRGEFRRISMILWASEKWLQCSTHSTRSLSKLLHVKKKPQLAFLEVQLCRFQLRQFQRIGTENKRLDLILW